MSNRKLRIISVALTTISALLGYMLFVSLIPTAPFHYIAIDIMINIGLTGVYCLAAVMVVLLFIGIGMGDHLDRRRVEELRARQKAKERHAIAALTNAINSGCGRNGRDLNSGWN